MLSNKIEKNQPLILKIATGEEIIGRFQSESMTGITLAKAFAVIMHPTQNGMTPSLAPVLMVSDPMKDMIEIEKAQVVVRFKPDENHVLVQEYQRTVSGIVPAQNVPNLAV